MPASDLPWFDLRGKTALVSGVTSAVGLQIAYALGGAGARLMLVAEDADGLESVVADLQSAGIDARWLAADSTQPAGVDHVVAQTLHRMGDIDVVVNHAPHGWASALHLNLGGYLMLSQRVVQHSMRERGRGRIINVAPTASTGEQAELLSTLLHQAAVDAVTHLTQALAAQWGPHHITVNAIWPTEDADHQSAPAAQGLKGACLLFASDAGGHITGQCLSVDKS